MFNSVFLALAVFIHSCTFALSTVCMYIGSLKIFFFICQQFSVIISLSVTLWLLGDVASIMSMTICIPFFPNNH